MRAGTGNATSRDIRRNRPTFVADSETRDARLSADRQSNGAADEHLSDGRNIRAGWER